jgi:hypothetical protein
LKRMDCGFCCLEEYVYYYDFNSRPIRFAKANGSLH